MDATIRYISNYAQPLMLTHRIPPAQTASAMNPPMRRRRRARFRLPNAPLPLGRTPPPDAPAAPGPAAHRTATRRDRNLDGSAGRNDPGGDGRPAQCRARGQARDTADPPPHATPTPDAGRRDDLDQCRDILERVALSDEAAATRHRDDVAVPANRTWRPKYAAHIGAPRWPTVSCTTKLVICKRRPGGTFIGWA